MPAEDVSDLRDVVDAINKLCETMKTSYDEYEDCLDVESELVQPTEVVVLRTETYVAESRSNVADVDTVGSASERVNQKPAAASDPEPPVPAKRKPTIPVINDGKQMKAYTEQTVSPDQKTVVSDSEPLPIFDSEPSTVCNWKAIATSDIECIALSNSDWAMPSDSESMLISDSDQTEPITVEQAYCDPTSEMYYTASSEVSLLSDIEYQDRLQSEDSDRDRDDRNSVMAGHVAAMRERFESMTRTNTPCPDLMRSVSPSFEVFRNISTSPDHLEKS